MQVFLMRLFSQMYTNKRTVCYSSFIFFTQYRREQCILFYMCTSLKPWRRKSKGMSEGREVEKMKINQFDSEQFLTKMGERLEWDPNGCDSGNKRDGKKVRGRWDCGWRGSKEGENNEGGGQRRLH